MLRFLLVSGSEKGGRYFEEMLSAQPEALLHSCSSAREVRALLGAGERNWDCCILNAPLRDELGDEIAHTLSEETQAQLLLLSPEDTFAALGEALLPLGVMLLQKPVSRQVLLSALEMMQAVQSRMRLLQTKNQRLEQKLSEMKLINRAKCVLISSLGMSEAQAHRHMERQAMNQRITKYEVAVNVLKLYEDRF
ncbi:MAG: ANTAR domain-containing protein [Oscillospiraceae bacterium]|jgi:response regulator NasT|nr:ANTAR domain-containing protein [Oscillospiraceae bacterium]